MSAGDILLYGALLSACLATVFFFIGRTKLSILLTRIAVASTTLAVLLLAYAFVSLDFSLFYVWQFSSAEMSIFYRLAAILVVGMAFSCSSADVHRTAWGAQKGRHAG
jgi:cytochrome c biogenesis factor